MSGIFEDTDKFALLIRSHTSEYRIVEHRIPERFLVFQLRGINVSVSIFDSSLSRHIGNRNRIISGNNFYIHALFGKIFKRRLRGFTNRIGKKHESKRCNTVLKRFPSYFSVIGTKYKDTGSSGCMFGNFFCIVSVFFLQHKFRGPQHISSVLECYAAVFCR